MEIIDYNEIIYLAAEGNYTYIHLLDTKPVLSSKTLKEYEDTLPQSIFSGFTTATSSISDTLENSLKKMVCR
ncbi:MAG: LytTR family transcriptional regulator [Candidatus Parvibacillus calidus]|nr:MAG: LytTR family transcriptional regulator [Candidatus Parvibacillus calidus]